MQVNTLALQHLFEKDIQYRVPLYQRPYVWNEDEQWQYLWDDIRRLAEAALTATAPIGYHFLGATVQDVEAVPPGTQETRLLIDGQQRMTTLQILTKAFFDAVQVLHNAPYAAAARRLAFNAHPLSKQMSDAFKVWPTNADRGAFQRVMECNSPTSLLQAYDKDSAAAAVEVPIPDCYLYFYRQMSEWLGNEAGDQRISALYVTLRERLRVVVIDLDHGDDAQMIFETLNARGTPLLAADLVKNSLLAEVEKSGANAAESYDRYWRTFDESQEFWRAPVGRGHARRARIEGFMHHAITLMTREESSASELYSGYKKLVRSGVGGTAEERLKTFKRYGDTYRRLVEGSVGQSLGRLLYRLEAMDVGTAYPFLIALFDKHPGKTDLMTEACGLLDSFLVRRMVCRLSTRGYNKVFLDLVTAIHSSDDPVAAIDKRLRAGKGENERWPDDASFERAWLSIPLYTSLTRGRMRLLLEALEEDMRMGTAEVADCPRDLTIEHLMPQSWERYWPLVAQDQIKATHDRELRIHTIGNLTLLTNKLNREQSNYPWLEVEGALEGKREALRRQTVLHLNKTVSDVDVWDEEAIDARAQSLCVRAKKIWPGPASTVQSST